MIATISRVQHAVAPIEDSSKLGVKLCVGLASLCLLDIGSRNRHFRRTALDAVLNASSVATDGVIRVGGVEYRKYYLSGRDGQEVKIGWLDNDRGLRAPAVIVSLPGSGEEGQVVFQGFRARVLRNFIEKAARIN